ncbi:hypothetical protein VOLCADRAFT_90967 [Volvox carteri f. nagariensis]|uniref:Uncharacterized protein n=1 Tax=Volvox carteri f. nagariensis TaxID=3068 RepID=D8TVU9_VOLCA|nr:uncharacterized protein VOLCADRAFT_90967 [Volvox carteri f. nagariensis]EFJ48364.1 hypothetical protein VOLCADRAFT_90967 [Volvox carteri f. nagariensis]|eukprot:XP_002950618.1 hypothetical protein VOLCADRAFT_90967 [Volvox carteri f. nagariensis]
MAPVVSELFRIREPGGHVQSFSDLPPSEQVSDEFLLGLVSGLFSQDSDRIRRTVRHHYSPDAVLVHTLARAESSADVYRLYRAYTATCIVRPVVREIAIDLRPRTPRSEPAGDVVSGSPPPSGAGCAVLWVDHHVRIRALPYLSAGIYPTMTVLKFKPCPKTGRPLVYEQYDHISRDAYIMSLGGVAGAMQYGPIDGPPILRLTSLSCSDGFTITCFSPWVAFPRDLWRILWTG